MPTGALVVPPIMKDKLESTSLADYLDVNPLTPRKEKKSGQKEYLLAQCRLPITSSLVLSCSNFDDCGGLPAAAVCDAVTQNRIPYTQRLSLAVGNSPEMLVRAKLSSSLYYVAVTPVLPGR